MSHRIREAMTSEGGGLLGNRKKVLVLATIK
jgi:hypothetical protein